MRKGINKMLSNYAKTHGHASVHICIYVKEKGSRTHLSLNSTKKEKK